MPITSYNTGTASVAANGTVVTGQGTQWIGAGLREGDLFWAAGLSVSIASVDSPTRLTLAYPWPGSARTAALYEVKYTPDATRVLGYARQAIEMFDSFGNIQNDVDEALSLIPYVSEAAAIAALPTLAANVRVVSAIVNGAEVRWVRDVTGTALGGGWKPAGEVTARSFGGNLTTAHATGSPVEYGDILWPTDAFAGYFNMYGGNAYRKAMHSRVQAGRVNGSGQVVASTTDPNPMLVYQKFSTANRDTNPAAWDQVGYFGLQKSAGDAFGAALTGYARGDGGSGDIVGVHGRAEGRAPDSEPFGMWSYVLARPAGDTGFIKEAIGHEIDFVNRGSSATLTQQFGTYRGLIIATADSSNAGHIGLDVKKGISALEGWLYGARLDVDAVEPSAVKGDTKQLFIGGGSTSARRYGGISFEGGFFTYGIDTTKMSGDFTNNMFMSLKPGQRIGWVDGAVTRRISFDAGGTFLNVQNMGLGINGNRVLTDRQPAIPNATAGTEVATLNAILVALRAHGLISA